ncbi:MAG: DJ-1 family glyoxalase III [Candidatus Kapaibacterium sp.]|jgi:4-methyl-5(b-hydroxyethyl)-thiazole monophosphate biosynthesis|nr:DJ-1/PfpI family protein [Candidatus Kapabacteria bacterium]
MSKKILVPIADGTEEMEAVIIIDMLRRASAEVITAGTIEFVRCSRNVSLGSDVLLDNLPLDAFFDMIVIPGGLNGVNNLSKSEKLRKILTNNPQAYIGAICAGPLVLKRLGILKDEILITSHPSVSHFFDERFYLTSSVIHSGRFITSRGAGTAFEFSLKLIEILYDKSLADKIAGDIMFIVQSK